MCRLNQNGVVNSLLAIAIALVLFMGMGLLVGIVNNADDNSSATIQDEDQEEQSETGQKTISGVVEEVFEDCSRWRVFEDGKVVEKDQISCDGGSFIVVDGVKIKTSAGFTTPENYFVYEIDDLTPGDESTVTYITDT